MQNNANMSASENQGFMVGQNHGIIHNTFQSNEDIRQRIREWLSPPDPTPFFHQASKLRHVGTGEWFLKSKRYQTWKNGEPSFLWLYGIPGCGKSVLATSIIEDLREDEHEDATEDSVTAYYFFTFRDTRLQDAAGMLKSLIMQLAMQQKTFSTALIDFWGSRTTRHDILSIPALLGVLREVVRSYTKCTIILDALDECNDRDGLLVAFNEFTTWQSQGFRLLVTGRREGDLEAHLETTLRKPMGDFAVCLESHQVDADIQSFVQMKLSTTKALLKWYAYEELRVQIVDRLKDAHGM